MNPTQELKTPPNSKESEMMVLGCMLTSSHALDVAARQLMSSDFYYNEHMFIFQVLKESHKTDSPADVHLAAEALKRTEKLKAVGGIPYLTALAQYAGTSANIEEYVGLVRNKALLRRMIEISQHTTKQALADPDDVEDALRKVAAEFGELHKSGRSGGLDHQIVQPYTLDDLQNELKATREGLKTGYDALDEMVRIPTAAITLIAGRPSHGKTTLMLNLFINLIKQYPDLHFYFFSYEETRPQIAVKIINILSGWIFNEAKNLLQLEGYLKSTDTSFGMVEKGKNEYQRLVESGRLRIIGHPYDVNELATQISYLKDMAPVGAVFIDYIQKIKNRGKFGTRQLELASTSNIILETAKLYCLPIVMGAQLGRDKDSRDKVKLDNLREAGDLENDANLVLGIYNQSMQKAQDETTQLTTRHVEITVTPLKNRNGPVNIPVTLDFDRPLLKIKDK